MQYSLLVFEIVFTTPVISRIALIQGRWVGGGGGGSWVSQRRALPAIRPDSGAVLSADDRDVHKSQDKSRRPMAAVWHSTNPN